MFRPWPYHCLWKSRAPIYYSQWSWVSCYLVISSRLFCTIFLSRNKCLRYVMDSAIVGVSFIHLTIFVTRESCQRWRHRAGLIEQWNRINFALTRKLISFMYGPSFPEISICKFVQVLFAKISGMTKS